MGTCKYSMPGGRGFEVPERKGSGSGPARRAGEGPRRPQGPQASMCPAGSMTRGSAVLSIRPAMASARRPTA